MASFLPPIQVKTTLTCLAWYLVSSVTSQLTKVILVRFNYPLFLSQAQFLFGALLSAAFIYFSKSFPDATSHFPPGSVPTDSSRPLFHKTSFLKVSPLGLFQFSGKYASLKATSMIPLSTVSSIKALSPLLIVAGYRIVYNVHVPVSTVLSLTPLVFGVVLMIISESGTQFFDGSFTSSQVTGLAFCLLSMIIFAAQNIYGKELITWDAPSQPAAMMLNTEPSRPTTPLPEYQIPDPNSPYGEHKPKGFRQRTNSIRLPYSTSDLRVNEKRAESDHQLLPYIQVTQDNNMLVSTSPVSKPDRMTTIFYCSCIGFVCLSVVFLFRESGLLLLRIAATNTDIDASSEFLFVVVLIILDSLSHFVQTLLAFHLLGLIPALSYSIASMMKRIVLITVSLVLAIGNPEIQDKSDKWFGAISTLQVCGLAMISLGMYSYDRWGSRAMKKRR